MIQTRLGFKKFEGSDRPKMSDFNYNMQKMDDELSKIRDYEKGQSAYEVAVENGFPGAEEEWLESLRGEKGEKGADGKDGKDGFSPTIEIAENTSTSYKLSITNKDGTIITPNLKGQDGEGSGDMLKSVYDTDGDGVIDEANNAQKVNGHIVESDVPADAKFTDTTYGLATETQDGLMSSEDKVKLDNIENNANNYTHPETHPASMITQDSTHNFVTNNEKTIINNANIHIPSLITTENGVHGIRYYDGKLSYKDGDSWVDIEIGGGLTEKDVFAFCADGVTEIPNQPSYKSWYMPKVYIPSSVTTVGNYLMYESNIIKFLGGENITTAGNNLCRGCTSLTDISLPNLTTVGDFLCYGCTSLTDISLPNLTTAGDSLYNGCTSLTDASFPNLETAGNNLCRDCTSLTDISLPNLTTAGYFLCYGCTSLTNLDFGGRSNVLTITHSEGIDINSPYLTVDSLVNLANALKTTSTTINLKFNETAWNRLSASQQSMFTSKGYSVTTY